jgi:hypothetical protein
MAVSTLHSIEQIRVPVQKPFQETFKESFLNLAGQERTENPPRFDGR